MVARVLMPAIFCGFLPACTSTSNVMNLGTWIRTPEATGYCLNPDGSGVIAVSIQKGRVYQFGADLFRIGGRTEGTSIITFSANAILPYHRSYGTESHTNIGGKTILTINTEIKVSTDATADWQFRLPDESVTTPCRTSSPGYQTSGIPLNIGGKTWYLRPTFWVQGDAREVTRWWHWPALALLPIGLAVDAVTLPIQAYYTFKSIPN